MSREKELEHHKLCWWLIERKAAYYRPEAIHESHGDAYVSSDDEYDQAELRYLTLCRELGKHNTIVHKAYPGFEEFTQAPHTPMMEIDVSRPSVQLVLKKLGAPRR